MIVCTLFLPIFTAAKDEKDFKSKVYLARFYPIIFRIPNLIVVKASKYLDGSKVEDNTKKILFAFPMKTTINCFSPYLYNSIKDVQNSRSNRNTFMIFCLQP